MAFEATKREWSEVYLLLRLLSDGYVGMGRSDMEKGDLCRMPIAVIRREEHDGTRFYKVEEGTIHVKGENIDKRFSREEIGCAAARILQALHEGDSNEITSPDGIEEFLNDVSIYDLEARTEDRTDLHIAFYGEEAPFVGFCFRSRVGGVLSLLEGRAANFKFEQTGIRFAVPTVNKINATGESGNVTERMLMIERLGGVLKYSDVADKVFRNNLSMIDLHAGRLWGEMIRTMWLEGITKISDLTESIKVKNPLKINDDLIHKQGFYEYKVKETLLALATGMRPLKTYTGRDNAISGLLFVTGDGKVTGYGNAFRKQFADFLFYHTRLEKGSVEKYKYGYLERENGKYYFKLNLKISLLKR